MEEIQYKCEGCGNTQGLEKGKACPICGLPFDGYTIRKSHIEEGEPKNGPDKPDGKTSYHLTRSEILYSKGLEKKDEGDLSEAFTIFKILADRAYLDGMYELALLYLEQEEPDKKAAINLLEQAAKRGHEPSKIKLGTISLDPPPPPPTPIPSPTLADAVQKAMPSILCVKMGDSIGTGFIIEGGYVVTNAHVVEAKLRQKVIIGSFEADIDKDEYRLRPVGIFPDSDLAILQIDGLSEEKARIHKPLELRTEGVKSGEAVYTVGNPLGWCRFSVTSGIVSNPHRTERVHLKSVDFVIQTSLAANPGNSGGAVLDMDNKVVGLVTYLPTESLGGITMCIPAIYVKKAIDLIK